MVSAHQRKRVVQCFAGRRDALEAVLSQTDEAVDLPRILAQDGGHAGIAQPRRVVLAFVAQRIVAGGDNQRRWQSLVGGRVEWRQIRGPRRCEVPGVVVPEPVHGCVRQEIARGVFRVRRPLPGSVRHRVIQHLMAGQGAAGIAQALINDPSLVIFDEPMSGLDPIGRRDVRDIILRLRDQGKTVFFSSHILPDVEMICDRVGILVKGQLRAVGTVDELVSRQSVTAVELVLEGAPDRLEGIARATGATVTKQGSRVLVTVPDIDQAQTILDQVKVAHGKLVSMTPHKRSLEDLFLIEAGMGRS